MLQSNKSKHEDIFTNIETSKTFYFAQAFTT
ncbi:hypothetical protein FHT21_004605 [Pedobacter sp. SG908]|nr:hypothetical protein [Pedobacter sp. SG908]